MARFRTLAFLSTCLVALLSGCATPTTTHQPGFFVQEAGSSTQSTFTPQGWDWVPGSKVEIWLYSEPMRERESPDPVNSSTPRRIGIVSVDPNGMFGMTGTPFTMTVQRLCGYPPAWLPGAMFMAKDPVSGLLRIWNVGAGGWFSFKAC